MNKILFLSSISLVVSCAHQGIAAKPYIALEYKDFGPPALAASLIGNDYWQWQSHGDSRPRDYSIGVIVYRNVPLAVVQKQFPVIVDKEQDYRYVAYERAMTFLDDALKSFESKPDDGPPSMIANLKKTRNAIKAALGE